VRCWPPYEIDITDYLNGQSAMLGIEIFGHRRNSHGPLHLKSKYPRWTGPNEFYSKDTSLKGGYNIDSGWIDGYNLVACGLIKEPALIVKKK